MKVLPKNDILPTLKKIVSSAEYNVKISSPWITIDALKDILEGLKADLHVVLRASELEDLLITDIKTFKTLIGSGAKVYLHPSLHSKFVVVDDRVAVVGSANITASGLYPDGNEETAVLVEEPEEIKKLVKEFDKLTGEGVDLSSPTVGIVLNSINSISAEILLFQNLPEQTYLKIPMDEGFLLGRIAVVKSINNTLVSPFFNTLSRSLFADREKLETVLSARDTTIRKALITAYINEKNPEIKIAQLEVLGLFKKGTEGDGSILKTPMEPVEVGTPVYLLGQDENLSQVLKVNHAGYSMELPVKFGKLFNTELDAYIDLGKVYTMHMAVLGTTGSGKTTFLKRMLENTPEKGIRFFIFDLYGEYRGALKKARYFELPNTVFPVYFEHLKEIFRDYGVAFQEKSSEEKRVSGYFRKKIKPDLELTGLKEVSLEEMILEVIELTDRKGPFREELYSLLELLKSDYPEGSLSVHPRLINDLLELLSIDENVVFDFSGIDDPLTRVNIAGLLMKRIFKMAKKDRKRRIILLEEAQNFAPEKGFGEIQSGSTNIAFNMAKKIATEGRKLNLGLIAVTQRPANISKYVLSQLNTQVVFKLINRNDLEAVSVFFEYSKEDIFGLLPFLKPGTGFITGLGVPFGILTQVRLG